jgi:hypothetical protein
MIPTHILDGLTIDQRIAILAKGDQLEFLIHDEGDSEWLLQEYADRDGLDVLATHLRDRRAILRFVNPRQYEMGGEG